MERSEIKKQFEKTLKLSNIHSMEQSKLDDMCRRYYGPERYSDHDIDEIIETLDYGHGNISFDEFDSCMKDINSKQIGGKA